ncbi:MAG: Rnase Y domain-containing protein, partial [Nitrospiraceae bacterium]
MNPIFTAISAYALVGILGGLIGIGVYLLLRRAWLKAQRNQAEEQAQQIAQGARREAESLAKEAKLEAKAL